MIKVLSGKTLESLNGGAMRPLARDTTFDGGTGSGSTDSGPSAEFWITLMYIYSSMNN